jgi:hypothetical protein
MIISDRFILYSTWFLLFAGTSGLAQNTDDSDAPISQKITNGKHFQVGLTVGAFFANKSTANVYDGYGIGLDGTKNDFTNSAMNRKINYEYGGGNGFPDQIAPLLHVNHTDWTFDETDMPINLKYNPAILVGMNFRYAVDKRNTIMLNVNGTKLTVNGDFTITITDPTQVMTSPNYINYRTFSIIGAEQRLMFQLGYQRLLGDLDKLNCFVEGGVQMNMAKFSKNEVNINGLVIDLTTYYNQYGYVAYQQKNLTGVGFGAFAGIGLNLSMSPKWTVQLVYDPSYDKVNLGENTAYKLQHTIGMRAYYNF